MNRDSMSATLRAALLLGLVVVAGGIASGCVYRPNIQQGNLLEVEDVEQVQTGMTRSQVRYLLGTPMLADPFDPQRWDYIYTLQRGRQSKVDRSHFVVHFDGDKVSRVEKLDMPDTPSGTGKSTRQNGNGPAKPDANREPPPLPSIDQRPPDAPRPGSSG